MKPKKGLQRRALKAGLRATNRKGDALTRDELLGIKIQMIPAWGRILLFVSGCLLLVCGCLGWPWDHGVVQALEVICGLLLIGGGIFGFKKTLSTVADAIDLAHGVDILGVVAEGVGDALGAVLDA